MEIKLTLSERLIMPELLPESGDMLEMIIAKSVLDKTTITPAEITAKQIVCLKTADGQTELSWPEGSNTPEVFNLEESEFNLISRQVKKLSGEQGITQRNVSLCVKFYKPN